MDDCKVYRLNGPNMEEAKIAAHHLIKGDVIAVPTDTIYGVACLVQNPDAVNNLYRLKGRHPEKPVAVCLPEVEDVHNWAEVDIPDGLLEELLPGPVTLCFKRTPGLNPDFNPGAGLVGVRIPDCRFIRDICQLVSGAPVALTSANVSSSGSCLEVKEFLPDLVPRGLKVAFDCGRLCQDEKGRLGSTIVDLSSKGAYSVIRTGSAFEDTVRVLEQFGLRNKN